MGRGHTGALTVSVTPCWLKKTLTVVNMSRFNKSGWQVHGGDLVFILISTFKISHNKNIKTNEMWHNREHFKNNKKGNLHIFHQSPLLRAHCSIEASICCSESLTLTPPAST